MQIQNFPEGNDDQPAEGSGLLLFGRMFPNSCMKIKKIDWGTHPKFYRVDLPLQQMSIGKLQDW